MSLWRLPDDTAVFLSWAVPRSMGVQGVPQTSADVYGPSFEILGFKKRIVLVLDSDLSIQRSSYF